jgi:YHS domain-containing protein
MAAETSGSTTNRDSSAPMEERRIVMAIDPVCGMKVKPEKAAATRMHEGQTYYFCAPGCREVFDTDPKKYLSRATEPPKKQGVWAKLFKGNKGPE